MFWGTREIFFFARIISEILGFFVGLGAAVAVYRLFFHPLASVPGPRLAAVSNVWYAYHVRNGRVFALGKTLHNKYGPVVRVGPNEAWFDSVDGFDMIYRVGSGYEKSDFYLATALHQPKVDWCLRLEFPDTLDFLSERDTQRYRLQRRLIGATYQTSNLKKFEGAVDDVIDRAISQLKSLRGKEVDLKEWMHIIAVECLGATVLSWSPGFLRDHSDGGTSSHGYRGWKRKSIFGLFPMFVVAKILYKPIGRIFSNLWGLTYETPKGFRPFFTPVYQKSSRRINAALRPKPPRDDRVDLLEDLIRLHKEKPQFTETYLRRLAVTNFGAGHETMCSALTSAMAMIGSRKDVQQKIADEVHNLMAGEGDKQVITYDEAIQLHVAQASIKEAQRLYPVIGMSLARTVPSGGMHAHEHHLPPGTTVGCNPVALHRNIGIFGSDADQFNPDRWLGDATTTRAMERYNLTWGGGTRRCPGRHLAELIVFKVVPALVAEFEIEVTMPPEEEICFYFMAMLTGVRARFLPRQREARTVQGIGAEM